MLLLVTLGVLAIIMHLDIVLGAFAAGFVLRQLLPDGHPTLELRLNGLAFGLLIPAFFHHLGTGHRPGRRGRESRCADRLPAADPADPWRPGLPLRAPPSPRRERDRTALDT